MWVVRDLSTLEIFREVFEGIHTFIAVTKIFFSGREIHNDASTGGKFHIMLRVTKRALSGVNTYNSGNINPPPSMGMDTRQNISVNENKMLTENV